MDTNSNPSDDEIQGYMNFDKLVENARRQSTMKRSRYRWIALPVAALLISLSLVINWRQHDNGNTPQLMEVVKDDAVGIPDNSPRPMNPGASGDAAASPNGPADSKAAAAEKQLSSKSREETIAAETVRKAKPEKTAPTVDGKLPEQSRTSRPETATSASEDIYVQAEPLKGYTALYAYFNEHLSYPPEAVKDSIEGIETVSFIINERGRPTQITITHSLGALFDQEALRVIGNMPDWSPATLNGRPVASQLSVPLTFQLKRITKP